MDDKKVGSQVGSHAERGNLDAESGNQDAEGGNQDAERGNQEKRVSLLPSGEGQDEGVLNQVIAWFYPLTPALSRLGEGFNRTAVIFSVFPWLRGLQLRWHALCISTVAVKK
jgi:hypothetical protein